MLARVTEISIPAAVLKGVGEYFDLKQYAVWRHCANLCTACGDYRFGISYYVIGVEAGDDHLFCPKHGVRCEHEHKELGWWVEAGIDLNF